jgi:hypothetical protein
MGDDVRGATAARVRSVEAGRFRVRAWLGCPCPAVWVLGRATGAQGHFSASQVLEVNE